MRTMIGPNNHKLKIKEHIILRNFWEYYVIDEPTADEDIVCCLVMGYETEIGDVSLSEIKPFVISRTKDLQQVAPAPNYSWEN